MRLFRACAMIITAVACILTLFLVSDIEAAQTRPIFNYVMQNYTEQTGANNSVASIYLNYRIFDTVFEALMLLVSVMGVVHFSRHEENHNEEHLITQSKKAKSNKSSIAFIVPFILMLGMYIIINGHNTPGGGFQGGAALSAALICVYLVKPEKTINFYKYEMIEKYIFLLIVLLSVTFAVSALYLSYPSLNVYYLIAMNILIGLKVFCGLTIIFYRFVHFEDV